MPIQRRDQHSRVRGDCAVSWRSPSWSLLPNPLAAPVLGKLPAPLRRLRQRLQLLQPYIACCIIPSRVPVVAFWPCLGPVARLLHQPPFELLHLRLALLNLYSRCLEPQRVHRPIRRRAYHWFLGQVEIKVGRRPHALRSLVDIVARSLQVCPQ
jgi:hypothetical protein